MEQEKQTPTKVEETIKVTDTVDTVTPVITADLIQEEKTINNIAIEDVKKKVSDVEVFGDGDLFQLISKASSKSQGWMKSTKAMKTNQGVVVQVTTQQRNPDGSYTVAEALTFVPNAVIEVDENGNKFIY